MRGCGGHGGRSYEEYIIFLINQITMLEIEVGRHRDS